jgi:hypothetical protein
MNLYRSNSKVTSTGFLCLEAAFESTSWGESVYIYINHFLDYILKGLFMVILFNSELEGQFKSVETKDNTLPRHLVLVPLGG